MQAYKYTTLYNKIVQEQTSEAFVEGCIPEAGYRKILELHPVALYTPNYFIRIALALLTVVILFFATGLIWLMTGLALSEEGISGILIFAALLYYSALEFLVNQRHYYNAGIDNILMAAVITCLYTATIVLGDFSHLALSEIALVLFAWFCFRFADALMGMFAYAALYAFVFLVCAQMGPFIRMAAPFIMLGFSAGMFVWMKRRLERQKISIYKFCYQAIQILTLISGYISVNYLVVSEVNSELFAKELSGGWPFWLLTIAIPLVYTAYGIQCRKLPFIITGLALAAFSCYTIHCFYHTLPYEVVLVLAGAMLLLTGYLLLRYLKTPRLGFTAVADNSSSRKRLLEAEAALLVQLFGKSTHAPAETSTRFGGGSSGGGGAAGNF